MERDPNMVYVVDNMSGNVEVYELTPNIQVPAYFNNIGQNLQFSGFIRGKIWFNELLRKRLAESGWCDQVKLMCIETIKTQLKNGQTPRLEDLIGDVSMKARTIVPTTVKKELLMEMKEHLLRKFGYYDVKSDREKPV